MWVLCQYPATTINNLMEEKMDNYEFIAPCHFGLEAVLKKEIINLGYKITKTEDGKVTFTGDTSAICRANIFLRTTERVLLKAASVSVIGALTVARRYPRL